MHQSTTRTNVVIRSQRLRNGVTLQFAERGDPSGLPIVFLHGATDSWRSFHDVLNRLPSWMRAIAVSVRGHGNSSRPLTGYRFADFSEDVSLLLDALEVPAAILVGHSMGSYVAQRFAIDHAEQTLGLVLMGAFPTIKGNPVVQELWDTAIADLRDPVPAGFAREFQESTLARPIAPAALDTFVLESLKVPARVWRAAFAEFLETDFSAELGDIAAPTLIVWGERDSIFPRTDQLALQAAIPGSRLLVYPAAGHAFHWEDPDRFASDLVSFANAVLIGSAAPAPFEALPPRPVALSA